MGHRGVGAWFVCGAGGDVGRAVEFVSGRGRGRGGGGGGGEVELDDDEKEGRKEGFDIVSEVGIKSWHENRQETKGKKRRRKEEEERGREEEESGKDIKRRR